jgi:hypothetical protein
MGNLFDGMQAALQDIIAYSMGYNAIWAPRAGGDPQVGQVCYTGPTTKEKLFDQNYQPDKIEMEYKIGLFPGLYEAVRLNPAIMEEVTIDTIGLFVMKSGSKKWDGKTIVIQLEAKE